MSFLHILWDNMKSYLDYIVYLLEKFDIEIIVSYEVFWKRFCETVAMERIFCTFKQIYFYTSFIKRNETAFCKMTLQLKNQSRLTSFFNMKANKEWPVWYSSYTVDWVLFYKNCPTKKAGFPGFVLWSQRFPGKFFLSWHENWDH